MLLKYLVLIVVVGSTNGNPFTLGDSDAGNIPIAEKAATNNPFPALNGHFQSQGHNTGINNFVLYVMGGNVSLNFNGLSPFTGSNDRPEESSTQTLVTEPANDQSRSNGSDYIVIQHNVMYKLHTEKKNWLQANNLCIKEGGHLVVIDSEAEEELLLNMMNQVSSGVIWVGVHSMFTTEEWVTVHDKPLEEVGYVHWGPDEPFGPSRCVTLSKTGLINHHCMNNFYSMCEIAQNH